MAIYIKTDKAQELLELMKGACEPDTPPGPRRDWLVDQEGDFRLGSERDAAWFRPFVTGDFLVFGIIGRKDSDMSSRTYAQYHSSLIDFVLAHYDGMFSDVRATAKKDESYDRFH